MRKAKIMDKHPIRTSTSIKKAKIMDKHPICTSTSMKRAQIMDKHRSEPPNPSLNSTIFIILAKIGRFDESAISGVRGLQPEGIPPETVARFIGFPTEEVKALPEKA